MKIWRVYVDSSVFCGMGNEDFARPARRFFDSVKEGVFVVLVSELVYGGLRDAPAGIRDVICGLPPGSVEEIPVDATVRSLADAYRGQGSISTTDALDVAAATVGGADWFLSWNFRDIVNYHMVHVFNTINLLNKHRSISFKSPVELFADGDFDCVRMKREAQKRLMEEFEARKGEFASFEDFLHATVSQDEWVRSVRQNLAHPGSKRG